jgi:hypothetical protein
MAWEARGSRRYYTRSKRVNGRVVREYVGAAGSPAVELAAAADGLRRLGREAAARERHAERERHRDAEAPLLALCVRTDVLTRAALLSAGFHRHDRGQWRRRRRELEPTG